MGNTHGKKYHELVKKENESDKTLETLFDIASKGREEKNLVKYGKKEEFRDGRGNKVKMAFHHIISANLLKKFIHKLAYNALNQKGQNSNKSLELLNKFMFRSVLKYSQDSEYFFGFRNPELKTINFLTPVINDIQKEMQKPKNSVKKEVLAVDRLLQKDSQSNADKAVKGFSDIMDKEGGVVNYLNGHEALKEHIDKWKNFKELDRDEQLMLLKKINDVFLGKNNIQDGRKELVKAIKPLKIGDLFPVSSNKSLKYNQTTELVGKKTPIKNNKENIDFKSPEGSFEVHADKIIDPQRYHKIKKINDLMIEYLDPSCQNNKLDVANKIYGLFLGVVDCGYQKFNKEDWIFYTANDQEFQGKEDKKQVDKENDVCNKDNNQNLLNEAINMTENWSSVGFNDIEADIGNNFLSQIDLFVNDFIASSDNKLSEQQKDKVSKSITSFLLSVFIWLPYNIFEGPSDRLDDPARAKEENKNSKSGWKIKESKNQQKDTSLLDISSSITKHNENAIFSDNSSRRVTPERRNNFNGEIFATTIINSDSKHNKTKSPADYENLNLNFSRGNNKFTAHEKENNSNRMRFKVFKKPETNQLLATTKKESMNLNLESYLGLDKTISFNKNEENLFDFNLKSQNPRSKIELQKNNAKNIVRKLSFGMNKII